MDVAVVDHLRPMNWEWLRLPQIPNISLLPFEISKSVLSYLLRWILRRYINVDTFPDNIDDAIVLENKSLNSRPINQHLSSSPIDVISAKFNRLSIRIPWSNPLSQSISIDLDGLDVFLVPCTAREEEPHPQLNVDSLAQQYLDDNNDYPIPGSFDVHSHSATSATSATSQRSLLKSLINAILAKINVTLTNTQITLSNSDSSIQCKMASLEFGDVDLSANQRTFSLNGVELFTHTTQQPQQPQSSQMFMSAQESLHQTPSTHRILNLTNKITLTLQNDLNDSIPTINMDIGGVVLLLYPSTVSCLLHLIQSFPVASKTNAHTESRTDAPFIFGILLRHLRVFILLDELDYIINEDDLWKGTTSNFHIPGYYVEASITDIDITAPQWSMTVGDASVMASDSVRTFPLLIFDDAVSNAVSSAAPTMSDWLSEEEEGGDERIYDNMTWKLLSTDANGAASTPPKNNSIIKMTGRDVCISSTHLFADLAVVERFFGSDLFQALNVNVAATHDSIVNSLLQEADKSISPASASASEILSPLQSIPFTLTLDAIRVSLRCPPPSPHHQLRSGILTIDVRQLSLTPLSNTRTTDVSMEYSNVYWLDARHHHVCSGPKRITKVDAPKLAIKTRTHAHSTPKLTLAIPYIEFEFRRRELVGLQYLADDVALLSERIKASRGKVGENVNVMQSVVELVKSRLVVDEMAADVSGSSHVHTQTQDGSMHDFFEAENAEKEENHGDTEADLDVHLDAGKYMIDVPTINLSTGKETGECALVVADVRDIDVSAKFPQDARKTSKMREGDNDPLVESHRHMENPAIYLFFNASVSRKGVKTSAAEIVLHSVIFNSDLNTDLLRDIAFLLQPPPGVFENAVPSDITTLGVRLKDVSARICPLTSQRRLVVHFGNTYIHLTLRAESEVKDVKNVAGNVSLFLVDNEAEALQRRKGNMEQRDVFRGSLRDHWKSAGYVQIAELVKVTSKFKVNLKSTDTAKVIAEIMYADGRVGVCADSLSTIKQFLSDLSPTSPSSTSDRTVHSHSSPAEDTNAYTNLLASLDETAFAQLPETYTTMSADMLDDDIPTNLEYAESGAHQSHYMERGLEFDAYREGLSPSSSDVVHDELDDYVMPAASQPAEKAEVIVPGAMMREGFVELLRERYAEEQYAAQTQRRLSLVDVTLHRADVSLQLFDGCDWVRTRAKIEQEYRKLRRKLVRIRQLLSTGQQVDTTDELSCDVYGAYSVGLSSSSAGSTDSHIDTPEDFLKAIDEELGVAGEESDSEWQNLSTPSQSHRTKESVPAPDHTHTHTSDFKKSLQRSSAPFVEVTARDVHCSYTKFAEGDRASATKLSIKDMEVLDGVTQKSKWRKFMTALQKDLRGNMRESNSNMVEVTLNNLLTDANEEEISLLCRILPIKLNMDQDALDFLKRFIAFKDEGESAIGRPSGPYIRQAIIEPVEIKMDYKPKHVNYAALRQGKTMEMMNFFHFDGSEIILRRIMISGIVGWPRLFDLLQDTWTPDVKANQLSDVISGVAPVRSLVNVGSGVADLVLLPIEQYRHDKRIIRGLQKGGTSFARNAGMEAVRLGAKLINGTQVVLEHAESILANRPSQDKVTMEAVEEETQPTTLKQGMESAYRSLNSNLNDAAQTILAVPMEVFEKGDKNKPIIRAVPIAILKPLIGLTSAAAKIQQGFLNKYDEQRRE
ncbi:hypothetical protein E3P96_02903 [Wallemia ichthyophaga]|nr:hypothetical protein E3P96_02903 [Wallemia ichthyophaga]